MTRPSISAPQLEVEIYQLIDDQLLAKNRTDGTGWDWCWADWQRDWMNATPHRYAYRCLPLTIANQTGWWVKNPVGFRCTWRGTPEPGTIDFEFDSAAENWSQWINSQFGAGIITWNTPFLFRTRPEGSRLLITGAANYFKHNAQPLTALIESDWMSMSFTMNWKLTAPHQTVRFEFGEPLFQAIPLVSNVCADLERASVSYHKLGDNPDLDHAYQEWRQSRDWFHVGKANGQLKPDDWQKDYFQGKGPAQQVATSRHMTKVKPPEIRGLPETPESSKKARSSLATASSASAHTGQDEHSSASPAQQGCPMHDRANGMFPPGPAETSVSHGNGVHANPSNSEVDLGQREKENALMAPSARDTSSTVIAPRPRAAAKAQPNASEQAMADERKGIVQSMSTDAHATRRVDDEWRRWIAENLMIGQSKNSLIESMLRNGFAEVEATHEIDQAMQSPYFRGSELLRNRLAKRDWLLATYRKLRRLDPSTWEVERRSKLSRHEFLTEYYSVNRPVIITGMMDDWPAMRKWNLDYFAENFGDRILEVQTGRTKDANYETEREKFVGKATFAEFINKLRTAGETNDFYMTANNNSSNRKALPELWDDIRQIPEYLNPERPGGFLWMGPAGTITPFHHDLTNNFMGQVIGRKLVKLVPSWDLPLMHNHLHVFSRVDGRATPATPTPSFDSPQILECILEPGELLFLPIGCWHFVRGLEISLTVQFTNFLFDNDYCSFYTTFGPV
jgi:hypothetical protein